MTTTKNPIFEAGKKDAALLAVTSRCHSHDANGASRSRLLMASPGQNPAVMLSWTRIRSCGRILRTRVRERMVNPYISCLEISSKFLCHCAGTLNLPLNSFLALTHCDSGGPRNNRTQSFWSDRSRECSPHLPSERAPLFLSALRRTSCRVLYGLLPAVYRGAGLTEAGHR